MGTNIDTYTEQTLVYNPDKPQRPDFKKQVVDTSKDSYHFKVKRNDFESLNVSDYFNIVQIKDYFYSQAIGNLYKKSKFLQLYIQLAEEQITEDEYELELKKNAKLYFIEMKEMQSHLDHAALLQVLHNMPINISIDDLSEILGIKTDSLKEYLTLK